MQFLITTTFAVFSLVGVASSCPSVCSCTDSPRGPTVNCSNRGLVSIPKDIPTNTYILDVSTNNIAEIKVDTLNLPVLHQLSLRGNGITRVEAWFFSGMPNISVIDMKDNIISFISEEAFQTIPWQTYLYIKMFCGCNDNFPLWKWLRVTEKFMSSMRCYDYHSSNMFDLKPSDFYECSVPAYRTTVTTPSGARITRKKLDATLFDSRVVIGIAIGAGSLAGVIVLLFVIWRLWIRSKDKEDKFEQQQDKINSVISAIPPSTFPQRPTEKS